MFELEAKLEQAVFYDTNWAHSRLGTWEHDSSQSNRRKGPKNEMIESGHCNRIRTHLAVFGGVERFDNQSAHTGAAYGYCRIWTSLPVELEGAGGLMPS